MQAVAAQAAWALGKGVAGGPGGAAVWLNGLLLASDGGLGWHQMVPFALQMEQQRLQVPPPWLPSVMPLRVSSCRQCMSAWGGTR